MSRSWIFIFWFIAIIWNISWALGYSDFTSFLGIAMIALVSIVSTVSIEILTHGVNYE